MILKTAISTARLKYSLTFSLLAVLAGVFYFYNLDGWLMDDDEGAAFFEVWRLAEGEAPGVDFLAEQQPLFLLAGSRIVTSFGRDVWALRALAAVQVVAGIIVLGLLLDREWGWPWGFLAALLILASGQVYEQARIFRPDGMMLGWEAAGLGAAVVAARRNSSRWWAVAGACYGAATLWKLFGLIPMLGVVLYHGDRLPAKRRLHVPIVMQGFASVLPFILIAGTGSLLLYGNTGFYYREALSYHAANPNLDGALWPPAQHLLVFVWFLLLTPLFIFTGPLAWLQRRHLRDESGFWRLMFWQLVSAGSFLLVSRPIHPRYFLYLIPVFAVVLSFQVRNIVHQATRRQSGSRRVPMIIPVSLLLLFPLANALTSSPRSIQQLVRYDEDSRTLAKLIAQKTAPKDTIVADYATLNFLAGRNSIYEVPIIAGWQIDSGAMTAARLIQRLEEKQVAMVLVHVEGGNPPPHQLVKLDNYEALVDYLDENYEFTQTFDRNGQLIAIWERRDINK